MTTGGAEHGTNGIDEITKIRAEVKQEIQDAQAATDSAQKQQELAQRALQGLKDAETAAKEAVVANKQGRLNDKREEGKKALRSLIRAAEVAKAGILVVPQAKNQAFLANLAEKSLTISTASAIEYGLKDYIFGNKEISLSASGQPRSEFEKAYDNLKAVDPIAAELVVESLVKAARDGQLGISEAEAKKKFKGEEQNEQINRAEKDSFEQEWTRNEYDTYLGEQDKPAVRALYSVEGLADFAQQIMDEQSQNPEFNSLSEKDKNRIISEEIETKIVLVFSKIYRRIDDEKQSQFVEEIVQEGYFNSIQVIHHRLRQRLIMLKNDIAGQNQADLPAILKQLKFYKRQTEDIVSEREIDGKIKPISRPRPSLNTEQISLTEFLDVVRTESNHEVESRKFFHNIGALLVRSADPEKGFWPQISSYADQMDATDLDEIMHLPDNNIAQAAFSLYTKYLSEAFAKFNWIHQPTMFSPEAQGIRSQIQKSVLQSLKEMFPEKLGKDEWRLTRAMSFGLGLARAVFITEEEQAAWADPNVEQDSGGATFRSYYTNDNTALDALNPMHTFLRWQSEQAIKGPILFSLISGFDSKLTNIWDHNELWKRMQEYKKTFEEGMSAFKTKKPGERLFIELLANVGRVGSIITRDGWRTKAAYEGWLDYKKVKDKAGNETTVETKDLNYLNSFKNLDYIGFEIILDFINDKFGKDPKTGYNKFLAGEENKQERDEFIKYLFTTYIDSDINNLESCLKIIRNSSNKDTEDVERNIDRLIKKGRIRHEIREQAIEAETYKRLIYRALVGAIIKRMPTKLVILERDRTSKTGVCVWKKIREHFKFSYDDMDILMQDLMFVETDLRKGISEKMRKFLQEGHKNFYEGFSPEYKVTEEIINKVLERKYQRLGNDERKKRINNAIKIFNYLSKFGYLDETTKSSDFLYEFAERLRGKDAADDLKDRWFPFAIATEEVDASFLAFKNAGQKVLKRAHGDTAGAEQIVFKSIENLLKELNETAIDPEHKIDKLIEHIGAAQAQMEKAISKDDANRLAYQLASMTIAYFKKDTLARNIFTKWFRFGKKSSLAAEFTGAYRGAWEWDVTDIDRFIVTLEQRRILPKEPFDLSKEARYVWEPTKLFGITTGNRKVRLPDYQFYGNKLRKEHGASKGHITGEILNKYLPIFLIFLLYKFISDGLKKLKGEK